MSNEKAGEATRKEEKQERPEQHPVQEEVADKSVIFSSCSELEATTFDSLAGCCSSMSNAAQENLDPRSAERAMVMESRLLT